jgi:hypothetical protein
VLISLLHFTSIPSMSNYTELQIYRNSLLSRMVHMQGLPSKAVHKNPFIICRAVTYTRKDRQV